MNRKRVVYTGILIIIAVIVSITYFSYAFLTNKDEQHGKINVVVGSLDYKIESTNLVNNSIIVNGEELIEIDITSLNEIESRYELYYTTTDNNAIVEYIETDDKDAASGIINANEIKHIWVKINTTTSTTLTFNVRGGFTYNNIALLSNEKSLVKGTLLTAPVITGGSGTNTWTTNAPVITIAQAGMSSEGIKGYEYYKTTSTELPTEITEGTLLSSPYTLKVTTKGTNYVYYRTISNNDEKSEWSNPEIIDLDVKLIPDYGTSIPTSISDLYYTLDNNNYSIFTSTAQSVNYYDGNYRYTRVLPGIETQLYYITGKLGDGNTVATAGTNTITLANNVSNLWIRLAFYGGCTGGNPKQFSNLKLIFADGKSYTIQQAVTNNYIEPLVLYASSEHSSSYMYTNTANTITGGATSSSNYPTISYTFRIKNKSPIIKYSFYTNINWASCNAIEANTYKSDFDLSLSEFITQYKY